jgi:hypothetical protein
MVIRLDIEIWGIDKGGTKRGMGKEMGWWWKKYGAAGFCDFCVYLGVFLLLWRVFVSRIIGYWGHEQLVQ